MTSSDYENKNLRKRRDGNWFLSEEKLKLVEQINPPCSLSKCDVSPRRSPGLKEGSALDILFKK